MSLHPLKATGGDTPPVKPTKAQIESAPGKPPLCKIQSKAIPQELKDRPQWVMWRYVRKNKRWTKIPFNPVSGQAASTENPSTWCSWKEITDRAYALRQQDYDGLGFVFSAEDPYCGIDLDDAIDLGTGELKPWAKEKVDLLSSYTEISPSGTGVKIVVRGSKPSNGRCKTRLGDGEIEMYDRLRYFALTGQLWPSTPARIEERAEQVALVYHELFGPAKAEKSKSGKKPSRKASSSLSDERLLGKARAASNGDKFAALFDHGDGSGHGDDDSAADLALCNLLAFWTDKDAARMDRLFRQSALMREKWFERRGEKTYGEKTIDEACAFVQDSYRRNGHTPGPSRNGTTGHMPSGSGAKGDLDQANLTDRGNAIRLVYSKGADLSHCIPWSKWLLWEEGQWDLDCRATVTWLVKLMIVELFEWTIQQAQEIKRRLQQGDENDGPSSPESKA